MDRAAGHPARTGQLYDAGPLPHTSPVGRESVILSGDFGWPSGASARHTMASGFPPGKPVAKINAWLQGSLRPILWTADGNADRLRTGLEGGRAPAPGRAAVTDGDGALGGDTSRRPPAPSRTDPYFSILAGTSLTLPAPAGSYSLIVSNMVADVHEQLVTHEIQNPGSTPKRNARCETGE